MKTQSEIEKLISQLFFSLQSKVTSYSKTSVIRAIIVAVSALLADLWNEVTQIKRKLFPNTSTGSDLDALFSEIGLERLAAVNLSTILIFSSDEIESGTILLPVSDTLTDATKNWTVNKYIGWILYDSAGNQSTIESNTATTLTFSGSCEAGLYYIFPVVPANTAILSSISGARYLTTTQVIVGLSNPVLLGKTNSVPLGNRTIATCAVAGNEGKVQANELTVFETAIAGVSAVTNPIPSQPRTSADAESDDAFRNRATTFIAALNITTQAFYEGLAVRGNVKVLRSLAKKIPLTDGTNIYVATRSMESLSGAELTNLQTYIYDRSRAYDTIVCLNMVMTDIFISFECVIPPDVVLADYYRQVADALADWLDYAIWDMTEKVIDDDAVVKIKAVNEDIDIDLDTFALEASKSGSFDSSKRITLVDSYPRLARLSIKDTVSGTTLDYVLSSYPISQQTDPLLNPFSFL
jgi:uncharacterized phage protein gp47/JayE